MFLKKIEKDNNRLIVTIPLTTSSGKIRVKTRSTIFEYGLPHASKQTPFSQLNYIERQIGYDVILNKAEKLSLTTLHDKKFTAYNGKEKALYELSEYLYYFHKWKIISDTDLKKLHKFLTDITPNELLSNHPDCKIRRTHPCEQDFFGIKFYKSEVSYPLLIHKFNNYEIITEINIKEKQRAIGVQPMLYFCFPITKLISESPLIGRTANTKEEANFIFDKSNYRIIIEMIKIFGLLSENHNHDIIEIIKTVLS